MEREPGVSLIMPFLNEAAYLPALLDSLSAQSFEHARMTLIAVDDGSTDESAELVEAWVRSGLIRGRVVASGARSIPRALNVALKYVSPDDYVVRLDAHSLYDPDYVTSIVHAFETLPNDVWCVGGNCVPVAPADFGKRLHAALFTNRMGLGPSDYRHSEEVREVASVYLGAWRPGALVRAGGYDPDWRANEDAELAERIRAAGGRVMRVPARSQNFITRGARASIRQWSRYGYWRARTLKRHPKALRIRHVAPPIGLLGGLALVASPARVLLVPLFAAYAAAVWRFRRPGESAAITAASTLYFPLVQVGFACGMLAGLFSGKERTRSRAATDPAQAAR
jgi:glycosyltransferase involved in cell wall biosynthesis